MSQRQPTFQPIRRRSVGWAVWLGFTIAAIGWIVLIGDILISEGALKAGNLVSVLSLRADIVTVAQTAIVSGFALAVYGALRSGFLALTTFFDAVLQRSATPRPAPEPVVMPSAPAPKTPSPMTPSPMAPSPMPSASSMPPMPPMPPPMPPRPIREPAFSEKPRERNYVVRPDGSVEVETMFGTRLFATLDEARDFIR